MIDRTERVLYGSVIAFPFCTAYCYAQRVFEIRKTGAEKRAAGENANKKEEVLLGGEWTTAQRVRLLTSLPLHASFQSIVIMYGQRR